jgi:hypothetical protein
VDGTFGNLFKETPLYGDEQKRLSFVQPDMSWIVNGTTGTARSLNASGRVQVGGYHCRFEVAPSGGAEVHTIESVGGRMVMTCEANANAQVACIFNGSAGAAAAETQEQFLPTAGTTIRFGCRIKIDDVRLGIEAGLTDSDAIPITTTEGITFFKQETGGNQALLQFRLVNGGTPTNFNFTDENENAILFPIDTFINLGFVCEGTSRVRVYIEETDTAKGVGMRSAVIPTLTNLPTGEMLATLGMHPEDAAARVFTVERFMACQELV